MITLHLNFTSGAALHHEVLLLGASDLQQSGVLHHFAPLEGSSSQGSSSLTSRNFEVLHVALCARKTANISTRLCKNFECVLVCRSDISPPGH